MTQRPVLCGMIHVGALPGTPGYEGRLSALVERAAGEARLLAEAGFDAIMIENMHDTPYLKAEVGPEVVAMMTAVGCTVREVAPETRLGVQVLAGANKAALAVAQACRADFVRVEGFVFAHVGDEGVHDACAGELLRYRKVIGAETVAIWADVKKKHSSHALTGDVALAETAQAAEFFLADGVIVTGSSTGLPARPEDLDVVRGAVSIPVAVGSGITPENVKDYAGADMFIVGSCLKEEGLWDSRMDPDRVGGMVAAVRSVRKR